MTRQVSQGLLENSTWERIAKIEEVAVKMWRRHSPYLTFPACAGRSWSLLKQSIFNTLLTIFSLFKFSQRYNHSGSGSQKPWRHNRSFYSLYSPPSISTLLCSKIPSILPSKLIFDCLGSCWKQTQRDLHTWSLLGMTQDSISKGTGKQDGQRQRLNCHVSVFLPLTLSALDHISANCILLGLQLILVDPFSKDPTFTTFK